MGYVKTSYFSPKKSESFPRLFWQDYNGNHFWEYFVPMGECHWKHFVKVSTSYPCQNSCVTESIYQDFKDLYLNTSYLYIFPSLPHG